jgi:DNA-binding Lrp family transcriptional regulator
LKAATDPRSYDDTDFEMLRVLRDDGRISIATLADAVHLSRATAYTRMERLASQGVLSGFSARVDSTRLGLKLAALILLTVKQPSWRQLRDEISSWEEVEFFAFTTGPFDAIILVRVDELRTLRDVILERLQSLSDVLTTQTVFLLDEVVRRPYILPSPEDH